MSLSQGNLTFSQYTIFYTNIVFSAEADFRLKSFL